MPRALPVLLGNAGKPQRPTMVLPRDSVLSAEKKGGCPALNRRRTFPAERRKKRQKDRRPGRCACLVMLYKNEDYFC